MVFTFIISEKLNFKKIGLKMIALFKSFVQIITTPMVFRQP
jgi:hypothetical protein